MKAAAFEYMRPTDVAGALDALRKNPGAKLIAGGQSLVPMLNLRLARPQLLIDIAGIAALRTVEDRKTHVRVGATVTHAELENRSISDCALLQKVARGIAYRAIRNRGTVGGSMAHADPAADWPLTMAAIGATVVVEGRGGARQLPADNFMLGAFQTRLADDEILVAVDVPRLSSKARFGYYKFCRKPGEFPEASAAAVFDPVSRTARLYLGALAGAPRPLHGLATTIAREGAAAITDAAIATAVDEASQGDVAERRMRRAAVARALKEVFTL
jgi:aerobic carbon-monoxide dehydrogenase medium subunit